MRIAVLTNQRMNNATYRVMPITDLAQRGHDIVVQDWIRRVTPAMREIVLSSDLLFIYRLAHDPVHEVAREARASGMPVVWDNDDNLNAVPEGMSTSRKRGGLNDQLLLRQVQRMVRLSDVVTTPSTALADLYESWGAERVMMVENYLSRLYKPVLSRRRPNVTVGWTAGDEHLHDMRALAIDAACIELLNKHPTLQVTTIGVSLRLDHERYTNIPSVPYAELGEQIAEFDIGIAPLDDIPFNHARSNVKLKEYAACGVPWLASPVGSYRGLGNKEGGRLVQNGDWVSEIDRLVGHGRDRGRLSKRALSWSRKQRSIDNIDRWQEALMAAVEIARRRGPAPRARAAVR